MDQAQELFEYANDSLKVKVHRKPSCKVELEIEAAVPLVKEAHKKTIKKVGKEVTIAGFRKGKAPEELIEKNYSKQVETKWRKEVSEAAFQEALKLIQIPVLNNELKVNYNVKSISLSEGAELIIFFETEPTIPLVDPKEITLKTVERPLVNEDKVSETIRQLQLFFAEWTPVSDRGVEEADFVMLDVDIIEEDPPLKLFADVRFEVTDRSMAKWMKDMILGHRKNETLEGVSIADDDASNEDKEKLKPKKVRVVIKNVEQATLPELTDGFIQKIGAPSMEGLRKIVEDLLNQKADAHVLEKQREEVGEILLRKYPFDVPSSLVDREVRFRLQQLVQNPEYLKHWNNMTIEAKTRTVTSISELAQKAVQMFYLCRKILADAKIDISIKDRPKASNTIINALLGQHQEENPQENTEVQDAKAFSHLILEKAEDYIIAHASNMGKA